MVERRWLVILEFSLPLGFRERHQFPSVLGRTHRNQSKESTAGFDKCQPKRRWNN